MTGADALLRQLIRRGVRVEARPTGRVTLTAPRGLLTSEDVAAVREHKTALHRLLSRPSWTRWPEALEGATRVLGPFDLCALCRSGACNCAVCDSGTWNSYAGTPLCLGCNGG
jgi:hypothetical protein